MNLLANTFEKLIDEDVNEEDLHQFLFSHSYLLAEFGFGTKLIFSKPPFGSNFKADFALLGWGNYYYWTFVELERASYKLFTKEGLPTNALNKAIEQINSWWIWMYDYNDYAIDEFPDLSGDKTALIIIGRRSHLSEIDKKRLKFLNSSQLAGKLKIITYDTILDLIKSYSDTDIDYLNSKHKKLIKFKNLRDYKKSIGIN